MTDDTHPDGATPTERARIDPSPPPKRLDALPVLYLVGFLILASALIYLWKHPSLPQGAAQQVASVGTLRQELATVSSRLNQLESRPAPAVPNLAPLDARIAALEQRPVPPPAPSLDPLEARLAALEGRPPTDVKPLDARIAVLEARPAPVVPDVKPLDDRITALEGRPAPAVPDVTPLEARITAIEGRPLPLPVDLKPVEDRLAALENKPPPPRVDLVPVEGRVAALEAKPPVDLAPLQQRLDALGKQAATLAQQADALTVGAAALAKQSGDANAGFTQRLDQVEAQAKQTAASLAGVAERAQRSGRLKAASAALDAGQRLGDIQGAPPALARFAHDAPPTESALRLSFNQAADAAHKASQPGTADDQPFASRLWTRAQQSVTVRQGDRVLVGDPIAGVLEHARQALDAGDLAGAVKTLDTMDGPAKAAMSDWLAQAKSLLDARQAIGEMASGG